MSRSPPVLIGVVFAATLALITFSPREARSEDAAAQPAPAADAGVAEPRHHHKKHHPHPPQPPPPGTPQPPPPGAPPPPSGTPDHHPVPDGCTNRPADVTEMDALVQIVEYKGIQHGRNGDHEIAEGTLTTIQWTSNGSVIDTKNVHLAMNIASSIDPKGLPQEIPLKVGQTIEIEGEYIPASRANATTAQGHVAVVHFTHDPCGFVVIDGKRYQ